MLQDLSIKNFAVIEQVDLHFEEGMTVLTGETGAGKSIIIDAVNLLTGGRGSAQFVRHGEDKCRLQALFTVDRNKAQVQNILSDQAIDWSEGQLVIQRDIYSNGRQVSRINGNIVTIALLKEIGQLLVDISGQNNQQFLMQADQHVALLDEFGSVEFKEKIRFYQKKYQAYKQLRTKIKHWQNNQQDINQKKDILAFQLAEIESAQLKLGEEEELETLRDQLMNFQTIQHALQQAYNYLNGDEQFASLDLVGQAAEELSSISQWGEDYQQLAESVSGAYYQLQDSLNALSAAVDDLEYDEGQLDEVEERLNLIQTLKRKYGSSVEDVLNFYQRAEKELKELKLGEENMDDTLQNLQQMEDQLLEVGKDLSHDRRCLALDLEEQIQNQLADLYMEKARFEVRFEESIERLNKKDIQADGLDRLSFYVQANPGEDLKPLADVASGGELSRMMLAIKTLFAQKQGVETNILDEVDTGVSGRVATAIGHKIYTMASKQQVLCISHLPQVAAQADHHLYIKKSIHHGRTSTSVCYLNEEQKVEEIAQMLSGDQISQTTLQTARELRQQ